MIFCGALIVHQYAHYFAVSCIIGLKRQIIDSMESERWCINCSCRSMMLREMMHFSSFTIFAVDFDSDFDLRRATTQRTYVRSSFKEFSWLNFMFTHIQSLFDGSFFCCSSNLLKFTFFSRTDRFSLILKQITEKTKNFFFLLLNSRSDGSYYYWPLVFFSLLQLRLYFNFKLDCLLVYFVFMVSIWHLTSITTERRCVFFRFFSEVCLSFVGLFSVNCAAFDI